MKKLFVLFVLIIVVFAVATPSSAQMRVIDGGSYGGRQPYRGGYYGQDPRQNDPCYGADQWYRGVRGTIHAHEGKLHFRPCDPTNNRINTLGGGALASLGGAAIGGAIKGRSGAAIGAVGGAVVGGVIASRNVHNNCIELESVQSVQTSESTTVPQAPRTELRESAPAQVPVRSEGEFELSNCTKVFVEVFDGDQYIGRMSPDGVMGVSAPKARYRGLALLPQPDGRLAKDELRMEASASGWTFIQPSFARQGEK